MITTSTQYLRKNFSNIIEKINQGEVVLLIHKSVIVAEIRKPRIIKSIEATDKDIKDSSLKDLSNDFLSEKEMEYYLSLK